MKMKKNLLILLMLVICTGMMASGQTKKKKQTASRPAVTAKALVGHTYAKHDVKICDPELAAAYDNGTFKLVVDFSVYFVTEDVMQTTMTCDIISHVYSAAEMEQVKAAMGIDNMNETTEEEYYVKNGYIYIHTQKQPVAVINKGGQSITIQTWVPFDGNVLPRIE